MYDIKQTRYNIIASMAFNANQFHTIRMSSLLKGALG